MGDDKLLFPGDPDGSDAEVINCRCTLIYAETQMDVLSAADWDEPNALWASEEHDVVSAAWDESKHPRHPRGERLGGKFAAKTGGLARGYTPAQAAPEQIA